MYPDPAFPARSVDAVDTRDPHRRRNMLFVVVALIAIAALAWWWAHSAPSATPAGGGVQGSGGKSAAGGRGRPSATVGTAKVVRADVPVTIQTIGTVQPTVAATVRTQVAGILRAISFTEGQTVAKGQPIAQVDSSAARQAVAQAQGTVAKDQAALNVARVDLKRYQVLWSEDSVAKQVLDTQAATVQQAEGTLAADRAAVGSAAITLGYTTVRAPVSGRTGLRQVDLGSYITPSDTSGIVVITRDAPIDVSFTVPQSQLAQVSAAARRPGGLGVTALDQASGTVLGSGQFLTFDNAIDTATGTIKGKARFANGQGTLFPNQFVNIRLNVGTLSGALTVPVSAVRHGPNGDFVFTLTADRKARLVNVTSGISDGTRTVIAKGLDGTETVITEGADKLDDGSPVTLATRGGGRGAGGVASPQQGQHRRARGGAAQ